MISQVSDALATHEMCCVFFIEAEDNPLELYFKTSIYYILFYLGSWEREKCLIGPYIIVSFFLIAFISPLLFFLHFQKILALLTMQCFFTSLVA